MKRTLLTISAVLALTSAAHAAQPYDPADYRWYVADTRHSSSCIPMEMVFDGFKTPDALSLYYPNFSTAIQRVVTTSDDMAFFDDRSDPSKSLNIIRGKAKCRQWMGLDKPVASKSE